MARVNILEWIAKKLKSLTGIVEDGDTATHAISVGKYVIWKGNPCKASSAISIGDALSSSNLTALTDGVCNDLADEIGAKVNKTDIVDNLTTNDATKVLSAAQGYALNSKLTATVESGNVTKVGSYYDSLSLIRLGDIKLISMVITGSNTKVPATGSYVKVAGFPTSCKSLYGVATTMVNLDGHHFLLRVTSGGDLELYNPVQGQAINGSFTFMFI